MNRDELNRLPCRSLTPITSDLDHYYECAACGQLVDMRRLGDVFYHEDDGHDPIPHDA